MYEKYAEIRDRLGLTDYSIAKACGFSRSTFASWKKGEYEPKYEKLEKIANYMGVDPKCLLISNKEVMPKEDELISKSEMEIIKSYRNSSPDTKKNIRAILGLSNNNQQ